MKKTKRSFKMKICELLRILALTENGIKDDDDSVINE